MLIFKYGIWPSLLIIILLLMIIAVTAAAVGRWQFNNQIESELDKLKAQNEIKINKDRTDDLNKNNKIIATADLEDLPLPVKKWLQNSGVIGKKEIRAVKVKQSGLMKLSPEQSDWYQPAARQYITVSEPGFLWQVDLAMMPVINTKGRDLFYQGNASMQIKIASLLPVVNQGANAKINESALHRFLLELPWYPTAALNNYLNWQEIDSTTARATIDYQGVKASANFNFDQEGNLISTEAMRYKESDQAAERLRCTGELRSYQKVDGIQIPTEIDVSWYLDSGKFTWFKVEVEEISFEY